MGSGRWDVPEDEILCHRCAVRLGLWMSRCALVWSLIFGALFAMWLLTPETPGVVYAKPLGPCALVAGQVALMVSPLLRRRWAFWRSGRG